MNNKILSLLGMAAVAVGMTTGATSAQASTLGPGVLSVQTDGGIFFSNNAVDFTVDNTAAQSPGTPGTGTVTTPPNPIEGAAGIFGIIPGNAATNPDFGNIDEVLDKLDGRQFTQTEILISDFELPFFVQNNVTYDLTAGGTVAPTEFLLFDTDQDGLFGEATGDGNVADPDYDPVGDFKFFTTSFTRVVEPDEPGDGPFNVIFEFEGFFRDMEGNFKDTQAEFALFNGVTSNNPEFLDQTTNFLPGEAFEFQAGGDGRIGTLGREAPEPGTILGLTALAGLGLSSRLKRKAK
ncbi:MAG: PEP-CTERM sorting domain-containing protein [Crocosphaera sp.]|nr:PEP-CTERM sorting domain-containing protein [Crocosphaera sp.]